MRNFKLLVHKIYPGIGLLMIFAFVLSSCSTKKNTFTRRVYHNLAAHYNGWWNGNESLKEGVYELDFKTRDNYAEVLPALKSVPENEATSMAPYADRAIEKGSMVIQRHSMYFSQKEFCRWIDDSYFLIGRAYFYKREYQSARRTFEFILSKYDDQNMLIMARLWLVRTFDELEKYSKAQTELELLRTQVEDLEIPARMVGFYELVFANHYILQRDYKSAKPHLLTSLDYLRTKDTRLRVMFILGQIYYEEGDNQEAMAYFEKVIRKNPPYEMAFNAHIYMARCYDSESGNSEAIVKQLNRMLDDAKNHDFKDQIYYALSEIAFKQNDTTQGLDYLRLSVATSISNDYQKSVSALEAADIFFNRQDYENAQAYYDTTMLALPQDYPDYDQIERKTNVLSSLVSNMIIINEQDSLQMLAQMDEAERNEFIDGIIQKYIEEEKRRQEEEQARAADLQLLQQAGRSMNRPGAQGGGWYFYNPQAMSMGYSEFVKTWGKRKLEDLWRLSKKAAQSFDEFEDELAMGADSVAVDTSSISTDPKKRETYLQFIPLTEEQMLASNEQIIDAYYNNGFIYKQGLKDLPESESAFAQLVERFPDTSENKYLLQAYYQLYAINTDLGNKEEADHYRELIINNYPDSDYARILIDPSYYKEIEKRKNYVKNLYQDTYQAFRKGQYYLVLLNTEDVLKSNPDHELIPKFLLVRAMAVGDLESADSMAFALNEITMKYFSSDVGLIASDMLKLMMANDPDLAERLGISGGQMAQEAMAEAAKREAAKQESIYSDNPASMHYYLMIADDREVKINALKTKISDHNKRYHKLKDLSISSVMLDQNMHMITVGNFVDKHSAMEYFEAIGDDRYVMGGMGDDVYDHFVISTDNYPVFYKDKDVDKYLKFFEEKYTNKGENK